jgi:dolichol-phosphate mannosyltransferase
VIKTLLIIPTFNEVDAVGRIIKEFSLIDVEIEMLFVDDSPNLDTIQAIHQAQFSAKNKVTTIHRESPLDGIAGAYQAGYRYAYENNFEYCLQMDVDGQHRTVDFLKVFEKLLSDGGLVIGSRYTKGGKIVGWSRYRHFVSKIANLYFRFLFWPGVRDCTGGFRGFRVVDLVNMWKEFPESRRFSVHAESTLRARRNGVEISEVPITFDARSSGTSKMSWKSGVESLKLFTKWRILG